MVFSVVVIVIVDVFELFWFSVVMWLFGLMFWKFVMIMILFVFRLFFICLLLIE